MVEDEQLHEIETIMNLIDKVKKVHQGKSKTLEALESRLSQLLSKRYDSFEELAQ